MHERERTPLRRPAPAPRPPAGTVRPDAPQAPAAVRDPAALLALQRSAGNAAATRAVEADRHVHSDACGHRSGADRTPVQRSPAGRSTPPPGSAAAKPGRFVQRSPGGGRPAGSAPAPAPAQQGIGLDGSLGRDVPAYWQDLQWSEVKEGVSTAFLPPGHPVFRAIEEYARQSQELVPYTSDAGEKTRMGAISADLADPDKVSAMGPQGQAKLQNRLLEGKKNGPPPPRSRDMQITAIKVFANRELWKKYTANRQLFQQSLVEKQGSGFSATGEDRSERIKWSTGQRPDLGGAAATSPVPGFPQLPTQPGDKPPSGAGEAFVVHGTAPPVMDLIQEGGGYRPDLSANKGTADKPRYGPLGQGVYAADNTSKAQTYVRCPEPTCGDYDCQDPTHPPKQLLLNRGLVGHPNTAHLYDKSKRGDDHKTLKEGRTSVFSPGLKNNPLGRGATGTNEFVFKDASLLYPEIRIYYRTP
ncbi:hypothetical protein [Streptomyces lycii]|uniref:PARP catalytic domain-containing protein n=1 Tax=Streptomyces lycii TaxID=2654337 RepID=A0ABQ7FA43_9ACTN|nr:hypothetical protein [Streptomyces lycii]KAF4405065.1 hypothetical protein GCU69_31960 [Streptomyces lycii]